MPKSKELRHKNISWRHFSLILAKKYTDFVKGFRETSKLETFPCLSNFKISEVVCEYVWLKVKLVWKKKAFFWRDLSRKSNSKGIFAPLPTLPV